MLAFNMSSKVCLRIPLILTLITSVFNSQMFHLKVHSKILFLTSLIITLIAFMFDSRAKTRPTEIY